MPEEKSDLEETVSQSKEKPNKEKSYIRTLCGYIGLIGAALLFFLFPSYVIGHMTGEEYSREKDYRARSKWMDEEEKERLSVYQKALHFADRDKNGFLDYDEQIDLLKRMGYLRKPVSVECELKHNGRRFPRTHFMRYKLEDAIQSYKKN